MYIVCAIKCGVMLQYGTKWHKEDYGFIPESADANWTLFANRDEADVIVRSYPHLDAFVVGDDA